MHRKGRDAIDFAGGVDSHTSSGPVPVSVGFFRFDIQSRQNSRQHVTDRLDASTTSVLLQDLCHDFRFVVTGIVRWLLNGSLQVGQQNIDRCLMLLMKTP